MQKINSIIDELLVFIESNENDVRANTAKILIETYKKSKGDNWKKTFYKKERNIIESCGIDYDDSLNL